MSKEKKEDVNSQKNAPQPYSDVEITLSSNLYADVKKVSKGRYLLWGVVDAADTPY